MAGIVTADKKDSQEICFIPDNNYIGFIEKYRGPQETSGELVDSSGNVVGQHDGFQNYTIGQRKGLGAFGGPRFVLRIEPETRRVVIGTYDELGKTNLRADPVNWLSKPESSKFRCTAQIRYQHQAGACQVQINDDQTLSVEFDDPQFGVTPGQALVLYDNDQVLGGGWIMR